jgi:precorrin isomerase
VKSLRLRIDVARRHRRADGCHHRSSGITIDFAAGQELVIVTMSGAATVDAIRRMNQALADDPRFTPGTPILFDNASLDVSELSANDVRAIGQPPVTVRERLGSSPMAVVVPNELGYGLGRMSVAQAGEPPPNVRMFYSLAEASAWLRDPVPRGH